MKRVTIGEYLCKKYGSTRPHCMSRAEADIFNVAWPLEKGWVKKYSSIEIWPEQLQKLALCFDEKVAKRAKKGKQPRQYQSVAAQLARELSGPVTIIHVHPAQSVAPAQAKAPRLPYVDANGPDFLTSYAWRAVRMQAIKLHGAICMCCGDTPKNGAVINVDHIKPRKTHPHLALKLDNLQILCGVCNHGKGNWDDTDWRDADPASQEGLDEYSLQAVSKLLSNLK